MNQTMTPEVVWAQRVEEHTIETLLSGEEYPLPIPAELLADREDLTYDRQLSDQHGLKLVWRTPGEVYIMKTVEIEEVPHG